MEAAASPTREMREVKLAKARPSGASDCRAAARWHMGKMCAMAARSRGLQKQGSGRRVQGQGWVRSAIRVRLDKGTSGEVDGCGPWEVSHQTV